MPGTTKDTTAIVQDLPGVALSHGEDLASGYRAEFVNIYQPSDLAPLLAGLPNDNCPCNHWGYVFEGQLTFTYADGHEEVFDAGSAFHVSPGHTPRGVANSSFLLFSESDLIHVVEDHMVAKMGSSDFRRS
jgi:hypothetical protein